MTAPGPRPAPGVRLTGAGLHGRRYPGATDALVATARRWLRDGPPPAAEVLKAGVVHRHGAQVYKRYPPHDGLAGAERWLRRMPAVRAAEEFYRVWPVPAAAPLVALGLRGRAGDSLLVSGFVGGRRLREIWHHDARARAALPGFVALLYRHRVRFGDLHAENLLWDGVTLHLVDLDAMRNPAHRLKRLSVLWWVMLLRSLNDEVGVQRAHAACFAYLDWSDAAAANWRAVMAVFDERYDGRAA